MRTIFAFIIGLLFTAIFSVLAPGIIIILMMMMMMGGASAAAKVEKITRASHIRHDLVMDQLGQPRIVDEAPRPGASGQKPDRFAAIFSIIGPILFIVIRLFLFTHQFCGGTGTRRRKLQSGPQPRHRDRAPEPQRRPHVAFAPNWSKYAVPGTGAM